MSMWLTPSSTARRSTTRHASGSSEHGRDLQPSDQVLDAIARARRLAEVERTHLHNLVRWTVTVPKPDNLELEPLDVGMLLFLDSLEICTHRGAADRIGLAGQLVGLGFLGFVPVDMADAPAGVVSFVAGCVNAAWVTVEQERQSMFIAVDSPEPFTIVVAGPPPKESTSLAYS